MSITGAWYEGNPSSGIYVITSIGKFDWDDWFAVTRQAKTEIDTQPELKHVIADFSQNRGMPSKMFTEGRKALQYMPKQWGQWIVIGDSTVAMSVGTFTKLFGLANRKIKGMSYAKCLADALKIITNLSAT
jgi:hypothetical protein